METVVILLFISLATVPGDDTLQYVQRYDIAELMMNKYTLSMDEGDFTIFYRLSTTESEGEGTAEDLDAKVTSIGIDKERISLVIKLDDVRQTDIMSVRFPQDLVSAEGTELTLLVDGVQKGYEWSVQDDKTNMIFVIPAHTAKIEIIGTRVIPEFSSGLLLLDTIMSTMLIVHLINHLKKRHYSKLSI